MNFRALPHAFASAVIVATVLSAAPAAAISHLTLVAPSAHAIKPDSKWWARPPICYPFCDRIHRRFALVASPQATTYHLPPTTGLDKAVVVAATLPCRAVGDNDTIVCSGHHHRWQTPPPFTGSPVFHAADRTRHAEPTANTAIVVDDPATPAPCYPFGNCGPGTGPEQRNSPSPCYPFGDCGSTTPSSLSPIAVADKGAVPLPTPPSFRFPPPAFCYKCENAGGQLYPASASQPCRKPPTHR